MEVYDVEKNQIHNKIPGRTLSMIKEKAFLPRVALKFTVAGGLFMSSLEWKLRLRSRFISAVGRFFGKHF